MNNFNTWLTTKNFQDYHLDDKILTQCHSRHVLHWKPSAFGDKGGTVYASKPVGDLGENLGQHTSRNLYQYPAVEKSKIHQHNK